ncbi:MAG: PEP-CTERM sorting domain-containing protein [Phycisphaerales bacterium JB063]
MPAFVMNRTLLAAPALLAAALAVPAMGDSFTDFESFTPNTSVDGQGGWSATGPYDQEVVDDGTGNLALRISNAVTNGSFGDMPIGPRPGGIVTDTIGDPVNSNPGAFAGESSTGATYTSFVGSFRFRSATGGQQVGASVTVSADNGTGGRHGFIDIEESAVNGAGIDLITFDVDANGNFVNQHAIAAGLSYTEWHEFRLEIDFNEGSNNDVARYYVNGVLVNTDTSWENYYETFEAASHPNGVPVQTFLFRVSGLAAPGLAGGGFLFDDVSVSLTPEPGSMAILGLGGLLVARRRRQA